jgi:hypothetical protein
VEVPNFGSDSESGVVVGLGTRSERVGRSEVDVGVGLSCKCT